MNSRYKKNVEELASQLNSDERIEEIALFNTVPLLIMYVGLCVGLLILGRFLVQYRFIMLFTSLLSVWVMAKGAQAFYVAQNSCVIVTNLRTFGHMGEKNFSLPHTQVKRMVLNRVLFLDGGDAQSSVLIQHASNRKVIYDKIIQFGGNA